MKTDWLHFTVASVRDTLDIYKLTSALCFLCSLDSYQNSNPKMKIGLFCGLGGEAGAHREPERVAAGPN